MDGDLINIWGETDGSNTTGRFTLKSDAFTNTPTEIVIPKGFKAKIWALEIAGEACDVIVKVSKDGGNTWTGLKTIKLSSAGNLSIEKRSRPIVTISEAPYVSGTSGVLVRFDWSQATAAKTYFNALMEIVKDD